MSRQGTVVVPLELVEVLYDDDFLVNEEEGVIEEEEDNEMNFISEMPREDCTFDQTWTGCNSLDVADTLADSEDEADEEWEHTQNIEKQATTSPLSPPGNSDSNNPAIQKRSRAALRGCVPNRGRGRGARNHRLGTHSDLFEEKYKHDADFPLNIQEQIRDHLAARSRYVKRRKIEDDVEVENKGDEKSEEDFGMSEQFVWRGMHEWKGVRCVFRPESTGPTHAFVDPYDAMHAIWTDDIMDHIAQETNRYARSVLSEQRPRFLRDWFDTNLHEIWTLFAFWMMLGIIKMPSIKSCFTRMPLLRTDAFRKLFTESRYWDLNAAFHLADGTNPNNLLHSMGPIIEHLNYKFRQLYQLDQEICIDEMSGFKQYIKTKTARFAVKTYELCESATGYLWSFFVSVGRRGPSESGNIPSSGSPVLNLIQPLLNQGHTLFLNNCFNSPTLARWLKRRKTDCVGTLRPSRRDVPEVIKIAPLELGQFVARVCEDVIVVALQSHKRVTCISTYHDISQVHTEEVPGFAARRKLNLIQDFNRGIAGVNRLESMLEAYLVERKQCLQWNMKLFKRLLNVSIQNCRIIVEKSTNVKIESLAFRCALVQKIIDNHLPHVPRRPVPQLSQPRNPSLPPQRLTGRHFIRRIHITDEMRETVAHRTNLGRRNCVWCTHNNRRSKTVYECEECQIPLCLQNCFKEFHTIP